MQELMDKWKAQWTEAEAQIKALGQLRADLLETESEIRQALTNRDRMIQTHGYDGKTAPRFDLAVEAAFGKREQLQKSLSEEAEYEAVNVLAARGGQMRREALKGAAILTTDVPNEGGNVSPDFEQRLNARFPNTGDETPENPNQAFEEKLNRMYGKPDVNTGGGPFGGGPGHINAGTEQPSDSRFRDEGEGDPPSSYDSTLNSFFANRQAQSRYDQDELQIEALAQARKGANEVLTAFDVGGSGAKEIFNRVSEYMEHPRSADEIEAGAQQAEAALKKEFGHDYQKMTNAARHVLKEAGKRIPGLTDMMNNTGLGNDVDFIKRLAYIGKRRGFAK